MIETRLGDFEEVLMLIIGILGEEDTYAFRIAQEFKTQTNRAVSIGAVHSTLDRLENKGFLKSQTREGTSERGARVLKEAMEFKLGLWKQYPAFSAKFNMS
jgi:DNA-binding PadR family transcriptional regulator